MVVLRGSRSGNGRPPLRRSAESDDTGLAICAVTLALELLNSKVDHKGYQADSTAWGIRLCEAAG